MRRIRRLATVRSSSRREGQRRRPLHIEQLEHRSMLAADVGFVGEVFAIEQEPDVSEPTFDVEASADPTQEFVPAIAICPGVPDLPTIGLPPMPEAEPEAEFAETEDYLKEFNRFLAANPDWLGDHGADGIQLCVMTPSRHVQGVELSNPGEARAFDAWFEQEYPWYSVEPINIDESINFEYEVLVEDPIVTEDPVVFDEPAWDSYGRGVLQISYSLSLSFVRDSSADYFSWALAPVPRVAAGGEDFGFTTGATLTGVSYLDGSSWLSLESRTSDFEVATLTVTGGEIVQRSSVAATVETPFDYNQAAYAQFAASFMGGFSRGGDSAAESLPGGGGRRKARA